MRAICQRDPRFRAEAYHFVLEALDHTLARKGGPRPPAESPADPSAPAAFPAQTGRGIGSEAPWNVTGRDLLEGVRDLALDRFGALALEVVRTWGVTRTDDVGSIVFNMVESGLLQRTATDSPADYRDVFDFETAFDRGFQDRLQRSEVRLSEKPPG